MQNCGQLPGNELFKSVRYDNGSSETFLRWLWHELYGDDLSTPTAFPAYRDWNSINRLQSWRC